MHLSRSDVPKNIVAFHELYEKLTGHRTTLNYPQLDTWRTFMAYRNDPPFTHDDLRLVVAHLKQGIRAMKRNAGALKFHNLIQNPDYFEADLNEALIAKRPPPPKTQTVTTGTTQRIIPNPGTGEATRSMGDVIAAMRLAAG